MKIIVSACLAGENCKYNGGNNRNEKILQLMADHKVITVCPEQMGGLPTPRVPSEIREGVVTARDGRIVDKEFRAGAAKCLEIALREQPDLIILQSRSPSCGVKQHYDGTFTGRLADGAGVTAQLLMEHGFRCLDIEDLAEIHERIVIRNSVICHIPASGIQKAGNRYQADEGNAFPPEGVRLQGGVTCRAESKPCNQDV